MRKLSNDYHHQDDDLGVAQAAKFGHTNAGTATQLDNTKVDIKSVDKGNPSLQTMQENNTPKKKSKKVGY